MGRLVGFGVGRLHRMSMLDHATYVLTESYYGDAEPRGEDTWLWVKVMPDFNDRRPRKLIIKGLRIEGPTVVETERVIDKPWLLGEHYPPGKPERVRDVTYGVDERGNWIHNRVREGGPWACKLVRVRPGKTIWQRLRG